MNRKKSIHPFFFFRGGWTGHVDLLTVLPQEVRQSPSPELQQISAYQDHLGSPLTSKLLELLEHLGVHGCWHHILRGDVITVCGSEPLFQGLEVHRWQRSTGSPFDARKRLQHLKWEVKTGGGNERSNTRKKNRTKQQKGRGTNYLLKLFI